MATVPLCSVCKPKETDASWVEVYPVGSRPARWKVTVDIAQELCAEHRLKLLHAVGMEDLDEYSPPRHPGQRVEAEPLSLSLALQVLGEPFGLGPCGGLGRQ